MGGTVVARIDGGTDVFELLVGRLQRHRQTLMTDDRWSVTIRSYRQPTPPVVEQSFKSFVDSTTNPHQRWDSQDIISSTGLKLRQRIMHTVRNSAGPEGLVVMIEDGNAPTRTNWETKSRERKIEISRRKITQATAIANSQPTQITNGIEGPIVSAINQSETSNSMLNPLTLIEKEEPIKDISTALESSSVLLDDGDGFVDLPPEPPNHFRVTMASFPDSFDQLLSNSLVTSQPDPNPSLWIARSQTIWIHGSIWGLYSTHLGLNNSKSDPDSLTLDGQTPPDYWIRLGKVVNKGASNSSVSLPWAILEAS
ncbi:hypothetical protein CROQUDRAFT_49866 [Cronartium quercuum f. sp. fusiforme G11]|uniref:Uncharacterized protein n=1 Tax=Cronartium quercuum f. sp. fusiforme G11 TaxID=708437 RepID=A0A9P6T883_9BASI|nr:hypothetical protein CROQUDRAFT_49866 [Cronartium quercuum f. sp. fusiforme G11]